MTPIPLPVSDISMMWWWLVAPGVVLATSAGVVMSRIEERLSAPRAAQTQSDGAPARPGRLPARKPDVAAA